MNRPLPLLVAGALFVFSCGCGAGPWKISVENQSATPVTITVEMGTGNRTASVKELAQGPAQVIISEPNEVHIQAVTIEQAETKQILKPLLELKPGQHYAIVVDAGGKATGTVK